MFVAMIKVNRTDITLIIIVDAQVTKITTEFQNLINLNLLLLHLRQGLNAIKLSSAFGSEYEAPVSVIRLS